MDPYDFAASLLPDDHRRRIELFWQRFAAEADRLDALFSGQRGESVESSIQVMQALEDVSPDLMWEFGPAENGHRLCITAEWHDELRPLARAVRQMAPDLPRWQFLEAREPSDGTDLAGNFERRFRTKMTLSRIETQLGPQGRIDLVGHGKGNATMLADQAISMATYLLGEEVERDWIGAADGAPQKGGFLGFGRKPQAAFDPAGFVDDVRAAIARAKAGAPDRPYAEQPIDDRQTMLAQTEGLPPGHRRADLFVLNTSNEAHAQAMLSMGRFASPTYSRNGEWFVYLAIARTAELSFDQVDDRYALESRLHAALSADGTGGWVAGGTGRDTVYIDLAVTDVGRALERIAEVMATEPSAPNATVHFMDTGLEGLILPAVPPKATVH